MCGIIGYTGPLEADNILLNGLAGLEYRGYDSAGIAYFGNDSKIHLIKTVGKVAALKELVKQESDCSSHCGIGHTRWATHGGVTTENAHPHRQGLVTLIHNGIIENYHQLTEEYDLADHLLSQTDSEVAAGVLNALYERMDHDPLLSIRHFVKELQGSYGFCIMFEDRPGEIYAVRNVSPLVAAYTHSGAMIASDLTALIAYTKEYFVVPEGNIVRLTPYKVRVYDMELNRVEPDMMEVNWNVDAAMKNGFPHFMLKEIHEQPDALKNTILPRLSKGLPDLTDDGIPDFILKDCSRIHVIACGTAMHAGMVARALIEPGIRIPVTVSIASEFRYETPLIDEKTLVIVISQSGETIDTLAALLAALVIIPGMAAGGAELSSGGPGLMFIYLLNVFNGMPGGRIVELVFYICVLFAGLSSLVNLYEAPVEMMQERFGLNRRSAVIVIAVFGGAIALMIQGIVSGWMDAVSIYICPLGAMLAAIMFFWVAGEDFVLTAVNKGTNKPIGGWFIPLGRFVLVPAAFIALVAGALLGGIG